MERFDAAAKARFKAADFRMHYNHPAAELRARQPADGLKMKNQGVMKSRSQTRMAVALAIQVGLSEMKPNTQTLAIITGLISCSPGPIRRYHYPVNIGVQHCAALLGFT